MDVQQQRILSEVSYYHQFKRPLTLLELATHDSLRETEDACEQLIACGKLARTQGFYHLPPSRETVTVRLARYAVSDAILRSAGNQIRWIAAMPGVEAVFLCNSLATLHGTADSDIDFLIITHPKRLFAARFWTVLFARIFGTRPRVYDQKKDSRASAEQSRRKKMLHPINGLCLSFFVRSDALNLDHLRVEGGDIYLDHWLSELVPLFDPRQLGSKLRDANGVTAPAPWPSLHRRVHLAFRHRAVRAILRAVTLLLPERILRFLQWSVLPQHIKQVVNRGSAVVWTDRVLKFHDQDRRVFYRDGWAATLRSLQP